MSQATSLILPPPQNTKTPAEEAAEYILREMARLAADMVGTHQAIFNILWRNPNILPDDTIAALGTNAASVFQRGGDLVAFMLGAYNGRPTAIIQQSDYEPPRQYTVNQDGSITLT